MNKLKNKRISPVRLIPLSFLVAIIAGTLLLMLPCCTAKGESTDWLTALFTSTTSVCVTGLVVVDTYAHWSFIGQFVIMVLAQLGGLGIVTVFFTFIILTPKKITLGERMLLKDALNMNEGRHLLHFLKKVVAGTLIIEGIGALLYMIAYIPVLGIKKGIWASVFQGVSAFCNAGMDVVGPDSLISYRDNLLIMIVTMVLIVLGGLGFVVWFDLSHGIKEGIKKRFSIIKIIKRLPEHSRLVLGITFSLLFGGALLFFITEYNNPETMGSMSVGDKMLNALFQSVTLRTAGFATVPQEKLTGISCIIGYILMFIGGSPIGTAGGVKTVTMFMVFVNAYSYIIGRNENIVFKKRITEEMIRKASAIVAVSVTTVLVLTMILMAVNPVSLEDALYEVVSASATVGLSRGLTPNLNSLGRCVIIVSMYLGRIGPISMAIFFTKSSSASNRIRYTNGNFYIG
ncbi:MAG: potassium transporter TrkH [Lachnospiraceae bacterium]|nr:potassium transporter TrkH [Lachnospiraceae bacterium]